MQPIPPHGAARGLIDVVLPVWDLAKLRESTTLAASELVTKSAGTWGRQGHLGRHWHPASATRWSELVDRYRCECGLVSGGAR
jgi:hypothetical protein